MSPASKVRLVFVAALMAGVALGPDGAPAELELASGERPSIAPVQLYTVTDRPLYRPGDTVWFRAWLLASGPLTAAGGGAVRAELVDPRGGTLIDKKLRVEGGVVRNDLVLPADLVGGRYVLRLTADHGARDEREIVVASYELPRLTKRVELLRTSYRPGDGVVAAVSVTRADGQPAAGARLTALAWLDGQQVARIGQRTDARGAATVRFALPARIERGDALLTVTVEDGGATESIQRRIPIALDAVQLAVYPEGGDLVTGLSSTVYVAARSPAGEPVEVRGEVRDDGDAVVAQFDTALRGLGRFAFTPAAGRRYRAVVTSPAGEVALPAARASGCVLADPAAGRPTGPLRIRVACSAESDVVAVATLRGAEIDRQARRIGRAGAELSFATGDRAGAFRLTLLDGRGTPIAERLVPRGLDRALQISLRADRARYTPRDEVELTVESRDADGRPVAADLALAVVDDALLALADDRGRHILAELWLEPEMPGQRIDQPAVYLAGTAEANRALDLLLGTSGWRRFRLAR
jgi:alpha-2-macroglobulin-like protein